MDVSIIATLYSYEPVIASVTKLGANQLFLLIDNQPDENQSRAIKEIKKVLGNYIKIATIKTDVYNLYKIAEDATRLIDSINEDSKILLNVSAARKTKALGLMFAGYARSERVDKIFYVTKEQKEIVLLPKMAIKLNKNQRRILNYFNKNGKFSLIQNVYYDLNVPKSTFYKTLTELKDQGFISENQITDAGRIALL